MFSLAAQRNLASHALLSDHEITPVNSHESGSAAALPAVGLLFQAALGLYQNRSNQENPQLSSEDLEQTSITDQPPNIYDYFKQNPKTQQFYKDNPRIYPPNFVIKIVTPSAASFWRPEELRAGAAVDQTEANDLEREFQTAKAVNQELKENGYQLLETPKYLYLNTSKETLLIASRGAGDSGIPRQARGVQQALEELSRLGEKTGLCDIQLYRQSNDHRTYIHNGLWIDRWNKGTRSIGIFIMDFDCQGKDEYRFKINNFF